MQVVEALHPELMVMSGSRSLEISSNSDQNSDVSSKAPHHFGVHIEDQSLLKKFHPPSALHNPIA